MPEKRSLLPSLEGLTKACQGYDVARMLGLRLQGPRQVLLPR